MTLPTLYPPKYSGTAQDFLIAKTDRTGSVRMEPEIVAIPSGQTVNTVIGLAPFRRGFQFDYGSIIIADALGASVTVSIGYVYNDNITYTNNTTAFLALTAANTANAVLVPNVGANVNWRSPIGVDGVGADGWIVAVIGGATTTTNGNISVQINGSYDQP